MEKPKTTSRDLIVVSYNAEVFRVSLELQPKTYESTKLCTFLCSFPLQCDLSNT